MVKIIYVLFIVVLCFILTTVRVAAADDTAKKTKEDVKLQTTIFLDADVLTFRFILTNNSEKIIEIFPIMVNDNRIILTSPDGSKLKIAFNKFGITSKKVNPKTRVVWDVKASDVFDFITIKQTGIYNLVWKVDKYTSNEVFVIVEEKKQ
jgi:hypothetical protein